jgi:hypothetical protein
LAIEVIDEVRWKVTSPAGTSLFYFPLEERWRLGGQWGNGAFGAAAALLPELAASSGGVVIGLATRRQR